MAAMVKKSRVKYSPDLFLAPSVHKYHYQSERSLESSHKKQPRLQGQQFSLRPSSCKVLQKLHIPDVGGNPSSIYSCSIGHIWEHVFCHLGCWAVKRKFLKRRNFCLSMLLFGVVFSCFHGQKFNFSIFFSYYSVRTKKLHKIKLNFFFFDTWKNNYEF